jgi:hypothetical protein
MMDEIIPEDDEISIMPEDPAVELDPIDQYLLALIDQLESEA